LWAAIGLMGSLLNVRQSAAVMDDFEPATSTNSE
jgi:hypothetical protein